MREIEVEPIEHILKSYRGNCVCLELVPKYFMLRGHGIQIKQDCPESVTVKNGQWYLGFHCIILFLCV